MMALSVRFLRDVQADDRHADSSRYLVYYRNSPGWEAMTFGVPWLTSGIVFAVVYAGSVLATLLPARRASRVYPAEALRYE